jgi:zinc/manganese transport system permease protein
MSPWTLMALPFLECLVLVGIHSYLGIHVIKRKVIFVDLALAQIAALGTIVALFVGLQPHTVGAYVYSLLFTFLGAAVFSLTRMRHEKIPQEAVIGLIYALAAAMAILVVDRAPHGAEHIKEILTGTILWVDWQTVLTAAIVYSAVGVFHYIFREKFFLISNDPAEAYRRGISVKLWDFFFYMSFGLVITLSVHTAGVLLVFVFLIVPAIMAILITDRLLYQLIIGWGVGSLVSFIGLATSYAFDFPSGPMVVTVYGAALLVAALILYVVRSDKPGKSLRNILLGVVVTVMVVLGFQLLGNMLSTTGDLPGHNHGHVHGQQHEHTHKHEEALPKGKAILIEQLESLDIVGKQKLLTRWTEPKALVQAFEKAGDEELQLALASRLMELDKKLGSLALLKIIENAQIPLFINEALGLLVKSSGDDFGYDPNEESTVESNRLSLDKWKVWLGKGCPSP